MYNQSNVLQYLISHPTQFLLILIWLVIWKGLALWKAARLGQKWWFWIMLVANTGGLLEIFYFYFIARKYTVEERVVRDGK